MNYRELECRHMEPAELAEAISSNPEYDMDELAALCWMADMQSQWEAADGETFEAVAAAAAARLGVEI